MAGVGLLQLLPITCSLVARPVIHTLATPALGLSVPDTAHQTDLKPPPAVPGAGEELQGCVPLSGLFLPDVPSISTDER